LANRVVTVARSEPITSLVIEIIVSLFAGFNVRAIDMCCNAGRSFGGGLTSVASAHPCSSARSPVAWQVSFGPLRPRPLPTQVAGSSAGEAASFDRDRRVSDRLYATPD